MPTEEISSLTEFKNDASGWIERLQHQSSVILTQNGKGRAVVQSYEAWQQSQNTLAMLQLMARADADMAAERAFTVEEVFASAQARLKERLDSRQSG
ncbi:MAG: type II toxin-antitoxin system prevent-host-death family antitoxin [Rhodanobacteraceae bacterium]